MNNGDTPASPLPASDLGLGGNDLGLTKREAFAKAAMQGQLACSDIHGIDPKDIARDSVEYADALLKELDR
jgi:hypothetical protein